MSSTKRTSRKTTAIVVIIAMLVSAFSIIGMTAEEAHAAAKAKKPAKVTGFKVTQKNEVVTASWKKAKKVKVSKKKHAVKYQLETTVNDIFGGKKTTKSVLSKTKKSYASHPGTKFTFRVRAFYTDKKGKKVYGKWTAKKSQTLKNTNKITLEASRSSISHRVVAWASISGSERARKYDTLVFEFNGKTQTCGIDDSVTFNDKNARTIKGYARYTASKGGKSKVVKTPVATYSVGASNVKEVYPGTGADHTGENAKGNRRYLENGAEEYGAASKAAGTKGSPYIQEDFSDIGGRIYLDFFPVGNTPSGRANNKFVVRFGEDVKSKYEWNFYPANNKVLVNTLSLTGNNAPVFNEELKADENTISMKTNWQCTDGYIVGFDKSGKQVYCEKMGWTTNRGYGIQAPGDVSINGPYYKKCKEVYQVICEKSGANKETTRGTKINKIVKYLEDRTTYELGDNSLNDLKNIGFFRNKHMVWEDGISYYVTPDRLDYSAVLNLMLGIEGGSCHTFQLLETFVAKQIDPNATVAHADLSYMGGALSDHMGVKGTFSDGEPFILDMSGTKYGDRHVAGTAADMYNDNSWRTYVKAALGDDACKFWFDF